MAGDAPGRDRRCPPRFRTGGRPGRGWGVSQPPPGTTRPRRGRRSGWAWAMRARDGAASAGSGGRASPRRPTDPGRRRSNRRTSSNMAWVFRLSTARPAPPARGAEEREHRFGWRRRAATPRCGQRPVLEVPLERTAVEGEVPSAPSVRTPPVTDPVDSSWLPSARLPSGHRPGGLLSPVASLLRCRPLPCGRHPGALARVPLARDALPGAAFPGRLPGGGRSGGGRPGGSLPPFRSGVSDDAEEGSMRPWCREVRVMANGGGTTAHSSDAVPIGQEGHGHDPGSARN